MSGSGRVPTHLRKVEFYFAHPSAECPRVQSRPRVVCSLCCISTSNIEMQRRLQRRPLFAARAENYELPKLVWRALILLDSNRIGIKPGALLTSRGRSSPPL